MNQRKYVEQRVANAQHLRKPDPKAVFYDKEGRWIFEVYAPKETQALCRN